MSGKPATGPFSPRRMVRPLRMVILLGLLGAVWFGFSDYSIIRLPQEEPALFDFRPGERVLVAAFDDQRAPQVGDAVLFRDWAAKTDPDALSWSAIGAIAGSWSAKAVSAATWSAKAVPAAVTWSGRTALSATWTRVPDVT